MKKNNLTQGQHLTEVIFEFRPVSNISIYKAQEFLTNTVKLLKVEETHRYVNNLPPGFDILCGLKESCLYFGYWPEHQYIRFMASSCKAFNYNEIEKYIKKYFKTNKKIHVTVNSDESIKEKLARLWC